MMDADGTHVYISSLLNSTSEQFHKIPGSAIFLRYVKSSYQNDPFRSVVELFLVLFAIRYLLAPKYSTRGGQVKLSDDVCRSRSTWMLSSSLANIVPNRRSTTWSTSGHLNLW